LPLILKVVEAGRYEIEIALRDYKKGKFLLESREPPRSTLTHRSDQGSPIVHGRATTPKMGIGQVWLSVGKAMGHGRVSELVAQLQDPTTSVEDYEKTLECVFLFPCFL